VRGKLTEEEEALISNLPADMHPMTQFSMGVMACQPKSKFVKAYREGVHKSKYWEATLEDALDVCAKVSRIAALVFYNSFKPVCSSVLINLSGRNNSKR
jgi:citrate synthase